MILSYWHQGYTDDHNSEYTIDTLHMHVWELVYLQLFEADVDSHKNGVAQINSHATQVVQSCSPSMAAIIEAKLQELNQRSQQLISKSRERLD